jgi:hypothetical protein
MIIRLCPQCQAENKINFIFQRCSNCDWVFAYKDTITISEEKFNANCKKNPDADFLERMLTKYNMVIEKYDSLPQLASTPAPVPITKPVQIRECPHQAGQGKGMGKMSEREKYWQRKNKSGLFDGLNLPARIAVGFTFCAILFTIMVFVGSYFRSLPAKPTTIQSQASPASINDDNDIKEAEWHVWSSGIKQSNGILDIGTLLSKIGFQLEQ